MFTVCAILKDFRDFIIILTIGTGNVFITVCMTGAHISAVGGVPWRRR
jgi:hypothetical protein